MVRVPSVMDGPRQPYQPGVPDTEALEAQRSPEMAQRGGRANFRLGSNLVIQSMPVDRPLPRGDRPKPDDPLPANQGGKAPMPVLQPGGPKSRKRTCSPESPVTQMGGKPAVRSPRFERRGRAKTGPGPPQNATSKVGAEFFVDAASRRSMAGDLVPRRRIRATRCIGSFSAPASFMAPGRREHCPQTPGIRSTWIRAPQRLLRVSRVGDRIQVERIPGV